MVKNRRISEFYYKVFVGGCLLTIFQHSIASEDYKACNFPANHTQVDFRTMDSTPELKFQLWDSDVSHLQIAERWINEGDYSERVLPDIDFVLFRIPNDYRAFQLLIRYVLGGGRLMPERNSLDCYFQAARLFAPDDPNVSVLEGNYYYATKKYAEAETSWKRATNVGEAPEAHYNLGLLYFKKKDLEKAREHGKIVYEMGFPLQGLKRKLTRAGVWK